MDSNYKHSEITGQIIKAFYNVYNALGYGFLERVYHNAMIIELMKTDLKIQSNYPIEVFYEGKKVGQYFADLFVEDCVIVEIKAAVSLIPAHEAQLTNYLRSTYTEVGLLLNFGPEPRFKRKVHTWEYKLNDKYQGRVA